MKWLFTLLSLFTGYAALVYEVTWHRYLANLLGSQAQATAIILAVFLGGLAAGYGLFGRWSRNRDPKILIYLFGLAEIAIGLWALLFPWFYRLAFSVVGSYGFGSGLSLFLDVFFAILLIGFPTCMMGGTLPLLTRALSTRIEEAPSLNARIYAVNTAGAFAGCLITGFLLLPSLGLSEILTYTSIINLLCGITSLTAGALWSGSRLGKNKGGPSIEEEKASTSLLPEVGLKKGCVIGFLAGFYSLALQTVFIRLTGLTIGSSEYAFSIIVSVYILMIALGAWHVVGRKKTLRSILINQAVVFIACIVVYQSISYWPYAGHLVRIVFTSNEPAFYLHKGGVFLGLALLLSIPVGAMGRTLPLLFGATNSRLEESGATVGRLYGWNTAGSVVGAFFGGYVLLLFIDLDHLFRFLLLSMIGTFMCILPWNKGLGRTHKILTGVISAFAIGVIVIMPPWNEDWLARGLFRMNEARPLSFSGPGRLHASALRPVKEMLAYADGPNTTVSIIETDLPKGLKKTNLFPRSIYVNGKSDGTTHGGDRVTTLLLAHIPALLGAGESESVAVVGFGTGLSIGAFTLYPNIKEIDCLEISPVVRDFARFFDAYNHQVTKNPKVRWRIGDAYRFLKHVDKKYAIIMSEPSNPWVVGVERLFSLEFYEIVKGKLEKDGVYAQWVQTHNISSRTLGIITNTFASVFPFVRLFKAGSAILLIGSKASLNDRHLKNVERRFRIPSVAEELRSVNVTGPESLLALELWLPVEYFAGTEYHSLERPKLAFLAGKESFYGDDLRLNDIMKKRSTRPWVRLGSENTLLARWMSQKPEAQIETIKRALPVLYGSKNVNFSLGWKKKNRRFRMAMLRLALEGELDSNGQVPERMLSGLKQLLEDVVKEVEPYGTVKDAYQAIRFFGENDSIFLPLSPERLIKQVSICFETATGNAYVCRSQLIEALTQTGRGELAEKYYEQLLRSGVDVPGRIQMDLLKGIREARRAGDTIRTSQGRKSLP